MDAQDADAFGILVGRYAPLVTEVCRSVLGQEQDAEDAFQMTFLVLAKQARAIRNAGSLGPWLYGVAYRTALTARRRAARRQCVENQGTRPMPEPSPDAAASLRELQTLLHKEVSRLPEKYRKPFVLCCLQGISRAEAARALGWKEGTVAGRVAEARRLLHKRLARCGLALTAALTAREVAIPAPPARLIGLTVEAAVRLANGRTLAGFLSADALALFRGVTRAMAIKKVVNGALLVTLLGLVAGGAVWAAHQTHSPAPRVPPPTNNEVAPPPIVPVKLAPRRPDLDAPDNDVLPTGAIARIGDLRLKHAGEVRAVALSADGRTLASTGSDQHVRLWDTATGKQRRKIESQGMKADMYQLALSPNGNIVALGDGGESIRIWETATGKELTPIKSHVESGKGNGSINLAFSPDGKTVAVEFALEGTIRLYDLTTDKEGAHWPGRRGHMPRFTFAPDGKTLVVLLGGEVALVETASGKELQHIKPGGNGAYSVTFSADGKTLLSGETGHIGVWDTASGKEGDAIALNPEEILLSLVATADAKQIVAVADSGRCSVLEFPSGKEVRHFSFPTRWSTLPPPVAFSADGKTFAWTTMGSNQVHLSDITTEKELFAAGDQPKAGPFAFTPDGRGVVGVGVDGSPRLWDTRTGKELRRFEKVDGEVYSFDVTPDGKTLRGAGAGLVSWDMSNGRELDRFPLQTGFQPLTGFTTSSDGKLVAAGEVDSSSSPFPRDCSVYWWDAATGKEVGHAEKAHHGSVSGVAFSPGGKTLASAGYDRTIALWNVATGKEQRRLNRVHCSDCRLSFSPDGKVLFSAEAYFNDKGKHTVRLTRWNAESGEELDHWDTSGVETTFAAIAPDGKAAAFLRPERTLVILDLKTGEALGKVQLPQGVARFVAFSRDSRYFATGCSDGTIMIWDRQAIDAP
jgi:RNA polymerase sigma factor (sigma-70 family)